MRSPENLKISEPISRSISEGLASAIPERALTVSEWAEKHRVVSQERVANLALAGKWSNEVTPYLVGIMDSVNEPGVNEIVFIKSSQVGGSELLNNIIGYYIHIDPATILYACENEGKARAWSVESFAPMIRDTPALARIFGDAKSRDSSNMIEAKAFRGGHFALAWATSPATLSSRPRRIVLTDETDAFEPTKEGDPIKLAEARTKTAGEHRKIVHVTTPRDMANSRVYPLWEESDRCFYFLPCPDCGEYQNLVWSNVKWDEGNPQDAWYVCDHCGVMIEEDSKHEMLAKGEWRSTNPDYRGNRRAFWINELYSPFSTWGEMATAFLEAKRFKDTLKVFVNTRLAQFWEDEDGEEEVDVSDIEAKREEYHAKVPEGVVVLTAGVDVQDDRLELEIVGWGRGLESWSIDYKTIYGSPALAEVWDSLAEVLDSVYTGENGHEFSISCAGIDSGGHHTEAVYKFCKKHQRKRWFAVKGANVYGKPIVSPPSIVGREKVRLFTVGTDTAKDQIFSFLRVTKPGAPGYCHFPDWYDEDYFKKLYSEKKITRYRAGVASRQWVKLRPSTRNEALDCRVYATAARVILNPNLEMLAESLGVQSVKMETETVENVPNPRRMRRFGRATGADWR
jgi:phage terminase large subunit GpA-like protein